MLYILHRGNHPDLNYNEGQQPIVHLQADLHAVVEWAGQKRRRWAFSDRNAGTRYVNFFNELARLAELNWSAIATNQWSDATIKEGKQAEFLVYESFPWELVERIGVCDPRALAQVESVLASAGRRPMAAVKRDWYY
jgi:hypothetical protein